MLVEKPIAPSQRTETFMNINWFIFLGGILWVCGGIQAYANGNYRMAIVSIAYAISQFALTGAK